jgi:FeS assembly SUF system protein
MVAPLSEWMGKLRASGEPAESSVEPTRGPVTGTAAEHTGQQTTAHSSGAQLAASSNGTLDVEALRDKVIATLREIYDPEIPVNIYDLGLIYRVDVSPEGGVDIDMTLTTPGCPVAATFPGMVETMVANMPEIIAAHVELVWDPPWTMDLMPEEVKLELGLL